MESHTLDLNDVVVNDTQTDRLQVNQNTNTNSSQTSSNLNALQSVHEIKGAQFKLSRRRWAILAAICTFGLCNGFVNELSPFLKLILKLLDMPIERYVYLSQIFSYVTPFSAIPTAWFIDRYGLRRSIYFAILLLAIKNISRALLFYPSLAYWSEMKFFYWFVSGLLTIQLVILYYSLPLKISENWFPKEERSLAWTCMIAAPQVGSASSALLTPKLVTQMQSTEPFVYMNVIGLILTILVLVTSVTRSLPSEVPSERRLKATKVDGQSIWCSISAIFKLPSLMVQIIACGTLDSTYYSICGVLADIFAGLGFSAVFCGEFLASVSFVAVTFQLVGAIRIDSKSKDTKTGNSNIKTNSVTNETSGQSQKGAEKKWPTNTSDARAATNNRQANSSNGDREPNVGTCKFLVGSLATAFVVFVVSLGTKQIIGQYQWICIMATAIIYTAVRSFASARLNDLAAHQIAGRTSEASVAAFGTIGVCLSGSVSSILFIYLRKEDSQSHQPDYTNSLMFAAFVVVCCAISFISLVRLPRAQRRQSIQSANQTPNLDQ